MFVLLFTRTYVSFYKKGGVNACIKKRVFGNGLITDYHTMTYKGGVEVPGPMKRALKHNPFVAHPLYIIVHSSNGIRIVFSMARHTYGFPLLTQRSILFTVPPPFSPLLESVYAVHLHFIRFAGIKWM